MVDESSFNKSNENIITPPRLGLFAILFCLLTFILQLIGDFFSGEFEGFWKYETAFILILFGMIHRLRILSQKIIVTEDSFVISKFFPFHTKVKIYFDSIVSISFRKESYSIFDFRSYILFQDFLCETKIIYKEDDREQKLISFLDVFRFNQILKFIKLIKKRIPELYKNELLKSDFISLKIEDIFKREIIKSVISDLENHLEIPEIYEKYGKKEVNGLLYTAAIREVEGGLRDYDDIKNELKERLKDIDEIYKYELYNWKHNKTYWRIVLFWATGFFLIKIFLIYYLGI